MDRTEAEIGRVVVSNQGDDTYLRKGERPAGWRVEAGYRRNSAADRDATFAFVERVVALMLGAKSLHVGEIVVDRPQVRKAISESLEIVRDRMEDAGGGG